MVVHVDPARARLRRHAGLETGRDRECSPIAKAVLREMRWSAMCASSFVVA